MKVLLFVSLLMVFENYVYARHYFNYSIDNKHLSKSKDLSVSFYYDLEGYEEEDFIVRPRISRGVVKILKPDEGIWISQSDLWTALPTLQKDIKLWVILDGSAELYFDIQNTLDQKIYSTKKMRIWGGPVYKDYLEKLNQNIKRFNLEEPETKKHHRSVTHTTDQKRFNLLAKVIKYIGEII